MKTALFLTDELGPVRKFKNRLSELGFDFYLRHIPDMPEVGLIYVELYPLHKAIDQDKETFRELLDATALSALNAGVKNRSIVICDPEDRESVLDWLQKGQPKKEEVLDYLAAKTLAVISEYEAVAAEYFANRCGGEITSYLERCALVFPEI